LKAVEGLVVDISTTRFMQCGLSVLYSLQNVGLNVRTSVLNRGDVLSMLVIL